MPRTRPARSARAPGEVRLVPRRWLAAAAAFLTLIPVSFTAMAIVEGTPVAYAAAPVAAGGALLVAALVCALGPARRRLLLPETEPVQLVGPAVVPWMLVAAWLLFQVAGAVWIVMVLAGQEPDGSRRWAALGWVSLLSVPDLVRLLTGRLHRWRLTLDEVGLTYRGYRTAVSVPWSQVRRARTGRPPRARGELPDSQVFVELRDRDGLTIPAAAFGVPVDQICEEINRRRKAARLR